MYTITHNGRVLFDPRLQGYPVDKPKLKREANTLDALSFTLYPTHPEYGLLEKKSSILNLYRDGTLLAQFAPTYHGKTFNGGIEYKCKNIICFLDDFYYRPLTYSGTVSAFFDAIIAAYNARVTSAYQVTKGNVHSADIEYETSDPKTYLEALKTVTDTLGGYIFPRFASGHIYLDYLQDPDLPVLTQKIMFGDNMTDLFIEQDTDNCFSVLYPFGTDENNQVVSISSVNGGLDYLENDSAVAAYGRREKMMTWTNVETPSALLSLAQAHLNEIAAQFYESVRLSAVDLHNADADIPSLDIYTLVDCVSVPHGYSHRYPITSIDIPLDAPQSESITLGMKPLSMTDRFSLERKTNASARSSFGRSLIRTNAEVESHWQHITDVTDQGMSDCFGVIGVKIDPTTGMPMRDEHGNYVWAGANDQAAEIWGHFHRTAWNTLIGNVVRDGQGNVLSISQVSTDADGNFFVDAINNQTGQGTVCINSDFIKLGTTGGATVTLGERVTINSSGYTKLNGTTVADALRVDMEAGGAGFYTNGDLIQLTARTEAAQLYVPTTSNGWNAVINAIASIAITSSGGVISLTPTYLDGASGSAVNFNIAATQFFQDSVAARTAHSISRIDLGSGDTGQSTQTVTVYSLDDHEEDVRVTVDASAVYTAGQDNVTIVKGTWGNGSTDGTRKVEFTKSAGTQCTENVVLSSGNESWGTGANVNKVTVPILDNGSSTGLSVVVDATDRYNAGWDDASALTVPPSAGAGTVGTSFIFKAPKTTTDQQGNVTRAQTTFNFTLTKGANPGSSGYAAVEFGGRAVGQIPIGDWYDAGWGAAYGKVDLPDPLTGLESNDTLTMDVKVPAQTVGTDATTTYALSATQWNGNTAFAKLKAGNDDILRLTLDATPRYRAGSYAVTLNNPDWGTAPNPLTANRTVSVSTSGRVDSNGTAANLTKPIALYLTQGSFDSAHKLTVSLRDTSSSGTIRAETEVDASGIYSDGQDSVNVAMGNWSNGSVTFSPSVGAGNSKTLVLSEISGSNSITSNGTYTYKVMYEDVYGNDQETGLTKSVSVNVSGGGSIVVNDIQLNASSYAQGKDQGGQMVIELGNNSDGTYPVEIFTNTSFQLNKWYGFRITVGNVYKNYYFKTN